MNIMPNNVRHITDLIKIENSIDNKCVSFIAHRDEMNITAVHTIDTAIYANKIHIASVMRKNHDKEAQTLHITVLSRGMTVPIKELLMLKNYYRLEYYKRSRRSWCWFMVSITLACIIGFILTR